MARRLAVAAALAGLLAVGARANGSAGDGSDGGDGRAGVDGITWEHDLDAAQVAAASQGRPLLVVFRCER